MATVNYAAKYTDKIDEVFRLSSVTDMIVNKGIRMDYNGVNSVTIYGVGTVSETNYTRSGSNRFGALTELTTSIQTFVLSQDKAFTYSIDRGNYTDQMMVTEAGSTLTREIEVVCVPNTDIYRLAALTTYAVAQSQSATAALSSSNVFTKILDAQALIDDRKVPASGRYIFVTPATYGLIKLDSNFIKASDMAQGMLKKGVVGEIDGLTVVKVPTTYLVANAGFLIVHESVLAAPHKFDTFRILKEVQGIDGWVVEGRRYYDAFIPTNHGVAMQLHKIA